MNWLKSCDWYLDRTKQNLRFVNCLRIRIGPEVWFSIGQQYSLCYLFDSKRDRNPPIERIAKAGHQRLGEGEEAQIGIEVQFASTFAWRLAHREDLVVICPCRQLQKVSHLSSTLCRSYIICHPRSSRPHRL
jgi:hypothetical protein